MRIKPGDTLKRNNAIRIVTRVSGDNIYVQPSPDLDFEDFWGMVSKYRDYLKFGVHPEYAGWVHIPKTLTKDSIGHMLVAFMRSRRDGTASR